jgi:KDO2-lipid IV(A) lauroyltransferase
MSGRLLYYLFIVPVSKLPDALIRALSYVLYVILKYVVRYRSSIISNNLTGAFPNKTKIEIEAIKNLFYRHLSVVFLDGIKSFSISKDQLRRRIQFDNADVIRKHYKNNTSVIITVGHYHSWELLLAGINLFIRHRAAVIYQPLKNEFLDTKLRQTRSDFRTLMISTKDVKSFFNAKMESPTAVLFAIDQAPANPKRSYWMHFLNQETPVHFGAEKFAVKYNIPVYHANLTQNTDGKYSLKFELITTDPRDEPPGYITEKATQLLESQIIERPEFWLWSHKRWKHQRPEGIQLQQLITEHTGRE